MKLPTGDSRIPVNQTGGRSTECVHNRPQKKVRQLSYVRCVPYSLSCSKKKCINQTGWSITEWLTQHCRSLKSAVSASHALRCRDCKGCVPHLDRTGVLFTHRDQICRDCCGIPDHKWSEHICRKPCRQPASWWEIFFWQLLAFKKIVSYCFCWCFLCLVKYIKLQHLFHAHAEGLIFLFFCFIWCLCT